MQIRAVSRAVNWRSIMRSAPVVHHISHPLRSRIQALADNWWLILLRGIAAIVFGVLAMAWPGVTLVTLVVLYGIFVLADGAFAVLAAIRGSEYASSWWLAIVGLLGIAAGIITLLWPGITGLVLLFCIAIWAIATGILQIVGAIAMRNELDDTWLLVATGALSVLFGALLIARPGTGALALVLVIASYAIIYGILLCLLAFRLRKHASPA
jgi:uncharacterized membrane protein HdeD (DUF308 family)